MRTRREHRMFVLLHLLFVIFAGVFACVAMPALVDLWVLVP